MNKITALFGAALVALSASSFAQDNLPNPGTDASRQERMNAAYREHREGRVAQAEDNTKRDAREAGHSFHNGVRSTGHAIHNGVRATGHAIHRGVRATGHAIHHGVNKVTGNE
jgi:hypothetical protein